MTNSLRFTLRIVFAHLLLLTAASSLVACQQIDEPSNQIDKSATQSVLSVLDEVDNRPTINAYIHIDREGALAAAARLDALSDRKLPLRGLTIAVKDNIHVAGMPNTAGTPALSQFVPSMSSPVVTRIEEAGGIILGKANMHELAYGITSQNFAYGPVRNPIDESRIPGGSSGGSAAAVAANMADAAIGTDTGASVRLPAALTGVVGFRPTVGRYSLEHVTVISPTRDTLGFIANTVSDIELLDRIVTQRGELVVPIDLSSLRLGVPRAYFYDNLDPDVGTRIEETITFLKSKGVDIVEADLARVPELNEKVSFPVVLYETVRALDEYLLSYEIGITAQELLDAIKSPDVKGILSAAFARPIPEAVYRDALTVQRPLLQQAYRDYFAMHEVDAVIFPTSPITARSINSVLDGVHVNGTIEDAFLTYVRNTDPSSNAGLPGISIPIGFDREGLPIGMEIDGPEGEDMKVLAIALALQLALKSK